MQEPIWGQPRNPRTRPNANFRYREVYFCQEDQEASLFSSLGNRYLLVLEVGVSPSNQQWTCRECPMQTSGPIKKTPRGTPDEALEQNHFGRPKKAVWILKTCPSSALLPLNKIIFEDLESLGSAKFRRPGRRLCQPCRVQLRGEACAPGGPGEPDRGNTGPDSMAAAGLL